MSELHADSPGLGLGEPTRAAPAALPRQEQSGQGWRLSRWLILIALVIAVHVGLLYMFGARKPIVPRVAADAPVWKLAGRPDEFLALDDPTLFALPHPGEFVAAIWPQAAAANRMSFRWAEAPRWLPVSAGKLMTVFRRFMQTNLVTGLPLQLKPPARLSMPSQPLEPALAQVSTMRLEGDLTQRRLLTPMNLPSLPYANVIAPSKVQLLVNEAGNVISAIILPSDNNLEALNRYDAADRRALDFARAARFAPTPRLTIGRMIFNWHTIPPPVTNSPAATP